MYHTETFDQTTISDFIGNQLFLNILGNCPTWRTNSFQYIYLCVKLDSYQESLHDAGQQNVKFLNMFRMSLRPSSGGQPAFSLPMVLCPVVTVVMLESLLASCLHCVE